MRLRSRIIRQLILGPRRTAVVDDQRSWPAIQLYVAALHVARAIETETGAAHIGLMLPTSGLFPVSLLATWLLGRTAVPLNYLLAADELAYVIEDAELDTIVTVGPMLEYVGKFPENVKTIKLEDLSYKGFPPFRFGRRRGDDHLAALLYTSGTSGRPKGVMLTARNLTSNVAQCAEWVTFSKDDTVLGVLPQFHSFGLTVLTLLPLANGCKVVYTARFVPRKILGLLRKHRPTVLIGIPSMFNVLLQTKSAQGDDFSSLRYVVSGGEPLPRVIADRFHDRFGVTINEGYGLTETGPVTNWCRPEEHRPGSVGMPLPQVEEKIVDPDGRRLGADTEGEVCIRGPNVMAGYYKLPDQTAAVFDDEGYFRTGDMGKLDADGHLYITGRIKEMLIVAGENIFPREIEEVLNAHPAVGDSAVIGMQDPARGEVPLAFVELKEDASADEAELRTFCRERLARFKVPREIRVIAKLPRNPTGKIMRRQLAAEVPAPG